MGEIDVNGPLIQAMMLLETVLSGGKIDGFSEEDMQWAALMLVQQAWQRSAGHEETKLPDSTSQILAKIHADSAIEIAKRGNCGARN